MSSIKLKDERTLSTTHNGFKYFVTDKKGKETVPVTESYFKSALSHAVYDKPFKKRMKIAKAKKFYRDKYTEQI